MPNREDVIRAAEALVEGGQFTKELAELVARPTESQTGTRGTEMRLYLEELLVPHLSKALARKRGLWLEFLCHSGDAKRTA